MDSTNSKYHERLGGKALCITLLLITLLLGTPLFAQVAPTNAGGIADVAGPFVSEPVSAVRLDIDLRNLQGVSLGAVREHPPLRRPNALLLAPSAASDSVAQSWMGAKLDLPPPSANFPGLDSFFWGSGYPPDTNGDVGPNHYLQTVNTAVGIFDKGSGALLAAADLNIFFAPLAPCGLFFGNLLSDPVVLYDRMADRWLITILSFPPPPAVSPCYECIAVSQTSDPAAGYWLYAFQSHDTLFYDYPKIGVWPDAYYMTGNLFNAAGSAAGYRFWALDRNAMLAGGPLRAVGFDRPLIADQDLFLPSNLRGSAPPVGSPNFYVSINLLPPQALHVWKFHVDFNNPPGSSFTGPMDLPVAPFSIPMPDSFVPQQGTTQRLETASDRLMAQLQYRNIGGAEALWLNHSVLSSGPVGVRWYEVRDPNGAPTLLQQGTYQPDSSHRWMGSLAVDVQGNMALGYSVSSSNMFPAIRYAGRLATDPLGTLPQGEQSLIEGAGAQITIDRWGDYSGMTIDPADDCTFWYTTEYYVDTTFFDNWQTRIGSFRFPSCAAFVGARQGALVGDGSGLD